MGFFTLHSSLIPLPSEYSEVKCKFTNFFSFTEKKRQEILEKSLSFIVIFVILLGCH